jgi:hypothetical protein
VDARRWTPLLVLVAIGLAVWLLRDAAPTGPRDPSTGPPAARPGTTPGGAEADAEGLPGGSLRAHEGLGGAHTIERHVGLSTEDLRRRAASEAKREVSTFPDLATADRAVAEVLRRRRDAILRWLERGPDGLQDFEARLDRDVGTVWRRDAGRAVAGRTVVVVLAPSRRFPEGFRVHTAYVTTP